MNIPSFEFLDHTADIKCKIRAATLKEIFEQTIEAVAHYCSPDVTIKPQQVKLFDVAGTDNESLLYNFIDELIYRMEVENFIAAKGTITLRGHNLHAEIVGDTASEYALKQIKAATYAEMHITQDLTGWEAQIVLDV